MAQQQLEQEQMVPLQGAAVQLVLLVRQLCSAAA
jgi:hypothetical protein